MFFLFKIWVWYGHRILGWDHIILYTPGDKTQVKGVTFTTESDYAEKMSQIT